MRARARTPLTRWLARVVSGALVVAVGVAHASASVTPTSIKGNPSCSDLGYTYGFKVDKGDIAAAGIWQQGTDGTSGTLPPGASVTVSTSDGLFFDWLERDYHRRTHSGIGEYPLNRFMRSLARSKQRRITREELDLVFFRTLSRKVRRDCTVSINGCVWETPPEWMGQTVEIRHPSDRPSELYIFADDKPACRLRKVDLVSNARNIKPISFALQDDDDEEGS